MEIREQVFEKMRLLEVRPCYNSLLVYEIMNLCQEYTGNDYIFAHKNLGLYKTKTISNEFRNIINDILDHPEKYKNSNKSSSATINKLDSVDIINKAKSLLPKSIFNKLQVVNGKYETKTELDEDDVIEEQINFDEIEDDYEIKDVDSNLRFCCEEAEDEGEGDAESNTDNETKSSSETQSDNNNELNDDDFSVGGDIESEFSE